MMSIMLAIMMTIMYRYRVKGKRDEINDGIRWSSTVMEAGKSVVIT